MLFKGYVDYRSPAKPKLSSNVKHTQYEAGLHNKVQSRNTELSQNGARNQAPQESQESLLASPRKPLASLLISSYAIIYAAYKDSRSL